MEALSKITAEERQETAKTTEGAEKEASYAVATDSNGEKYWSIESGSDIFKGLKSKEELREAAYKFIIGSRDSKVVYEDKDGKKIKFIRLSAEEFTRSKESTDYYKNNPETFNKKMRLLPSLKDLLLNYKVSWDSKDHKNHKLFNENGFTNYRGRVKIDDTMFTYIVRVGKTANGAVFYDINMETNYYLPHTEKNNASDMVSTKDSISSKNESVKYAVSEEYYEEISAWEKGGMKDTNKRFIIGETSEALQSIGMKEQEIILSSGTIIQKLKKHPEMSIEIFKKIPELLEKPIIVQFSDAINKTTGKPKYESRITVLGELYANVKEDGEVKEKPVLVSLELMPSNRKKSVILDFSIITSAYAKNSLQNYINNNTILYVNPDKKRTNKWLSLNRLQLPLGENQYGPIKIISYSEGKVKINNNSASVRYAVSEDYSDEVDNWYKSGQNEKKRFILGSTGNVLQGLGAIESDIYFNSEKINKILSEHKEITIEEIKKIPDILEDPVIILKSMNKNRGNKQNTRLVIFGSVKGTDGRPVLSVLDIRPVENNFVINDMQKVSSVYTKDINPVDFVQNSDVLYADKKRAAHLLRTLGFKMPNPLHQSDFIGSISYFNDSVNIEGKSFSEVFETNTSETASETAEGAEKYATDKADTTEESEEKKYFPKGEAPYRDVDVVSETDEGKNPRFIRTAAESEFTSEEMAKRLLEIAEEGSAAYDTYTDSEAVSDANRWFENQGNDLDKAAGKIEELIDAGALTSKKNFAKAQLVYNKLIEEAKNTADEYAAEKLLKRAENMIINVAMAGTRAGQTVQAMRLLKRLSPEGRLIALEKSVDELNSQGKHKQPREKTAKTEKIKKNGQKKADNNYQITQKRTLCEQILARLKEIGTDEAEQALRSLGAEKEAGATAKKVGGIDKAKFEKIKSDFGIKNINDYINVQRNVFETLKNEGFFSDEGGRSRTVTNKESGLQIEINKSSIDETFSSGNKFERLSNELKYLKLATVKEIADLIENAHLLTDDNKNYHSGKSGVTYAYLKTETTVDGKPVTVVMDIRKSPQKNKLWVHQVYTKNDTEVGPTGASSKIGLNADPDVYANISQDEGNVKENFSELDISKMSVSELEALLSDLESGKAELSVSEMVALLAQLDEKEAALVAENAEIDKELAELEKPTVEEERKVQLSETEKRQKKRAAEAEAESKDELTKAKKNYDRVSAELDEANKIIADQERILAISLNVVTHNYVTVAHGTLRNYAMINYNKRANKKAPIGAFFACSIMVNVYNSKLFIIPTSFFR